MCISSHLRLGCLSKILWCLNDIYLIPKCVLFIVLFDKFVQLFFKSLSNFIIYFIILGVFVIKNFGTKCTLQNFLVFIWVMTGDSFQRTYWNKDWPTTINSNPERSSTTNNEGSTNTYNDPTNINSNPH